MLKQVLPEYTPEFRTSLSGSNQLSATTTATPNQAFAEARLHPQLGQPPRLHPLLHLPLLLQPVDVPTYLIGPILMEMTVPGMKVSETARSGDKLEPMMRAVCVEEDQMTGQHPAPIHQRQVQWPLPQLLMYVRTMMRSSSTHHQYRKIANLWEGLTHQIVAIGQE